jgi:hypothetical protein
LVLVSGDIERNGTTMSGNNRSRNECVRLRTKVQMSEIGESRDLVIVSAKIKVN